MNQYILLLMKNKFEDFLKLVELGIIEKEVACETVIESKNAKNIYEFARIIEGVDISSLEDEIISTRNVDYINEFANNVKGANVQKLKDAVNQMQNYVDSFARDKGVCAPTLGDAITKSRNEFYGFARDVNSANIGKLGDAIVKNSENEKVDYIYKFAKDTKDANIPELQSAIDQMEDGLSTEEKNLKELMKLLHAHKYEDIVRNRETYKQLFSADPSRLGR